MGDFAGKIIKAISRDHLLAWLGELAGRSTLIGPKPVGEKILYKPVRSSAEIVLDFTKTDLSAKEHFLPSTEAILSMKREKKGFNVEESSLDGEQIIFGLRPCDARALRVLDALFLEEEPADPYYAERREKTTLIGLACREMGDQCFCTSLGLAPDEPNDVDLMLAEIEGGYAVQVVTDKGKALLGAVALQEVGGVPPKPAVHQEKVPILEVGEWPERFDDLFWSRLSDRCLSCRLCTYVCPTCRCFDIRDSEVSDKELERLRAWDSCMAEGYRRIAGGHNPRPTKAERLRNRFYCKFCYYPQDFGPVACVGCGRCIAQCPVNVDAAEVLEGLAAL